MNNIEDNIYKDLISLGTGVYYCGWFKGYLTIENELDVYTVMWTSSETSHDPLGDPAVSIDFSSDGVGLVFKSALTMHPVSSENEKKIYIKFITKKLRSYYKHQKFKHIFLSV